MAVAAIADFVPHQVIDLPRLRAEVTEHRLHRLHRLHRVRCPACGAETRATLPPEVPTGACGPPAGRVCKPPSPGSVGATA
jgi:hypothetical protein